MPWAKKPKGKLRLDSRELAMKGGTSGRRSWRERRRRAICQALRGAGGEDRMPLDHDPLAEGQIALIEKWIDQGAIWPDSAAGGAAKLETQLAYVKPMRPEAPPVKMGHGGGIRSMRLFGAVGEGRTDTISRGGQSGADSARISRFDRPAAYAGGGGCIHY